jgi:hypothetical protein
VICKRRGQYPFRIASLLQCYAFVLAMSIATFARPVIMNPVEQSITVKLLVDSTVASCTDWQKEMVRMFDRVNRIFRDRMPLVFRIDTMAVWQASQSGSYHDMLLGDCLIREQPKGGADVVVYMGMNGNPPSMIAMLTLYELGYAYVQPMIDVSMKKIDQESYLSLVHGLAHLFGAVHCYYDGKITTVMNPFIHDGTIINPVSKRKRLPPRFHQGNEVIMTALSRRPFKEDGWDTVYLKTIKATYGKIKNKYNPWRIDSPYLLSGYEDDAFHEGNLLLYLGSWASLCGRHQEAMKYYDSLEILWKAVKNCCVSGPDPGKNRLCNICGYNQASIEEWYSLQVFYLGIRRVMVDLRAGEIRHADSLFTALVNGIPAQLAVLKDKYRNGYIFHARRYGLKTRISISGEESPKAGRPDTIPPSSY